LKLSIIGSGCHGPVGGPCGGLGDFEGVKVGMDRVALDRRGKTLRYTLYVLRGAQQDYQ